MKFMLFIKHLRDYGSVEPPPPAMFEAMGDFVGEAMKNGVMIDGAGLQPLAKGTRVRLANGEISVTDGPFAEAKEVVGGYALCETATREEAVALARKFMDIHRLHWPGFEGEAEVRPLEDQAQ